MFLTETQLLSVSLCRLVVIEWPLLHMRKRQLVKRMVNSYLVGLVWVPL